MMQVQGFGFPFDVTDSSCSTLKPKTFCWTKQSSEIQVYIDGAILGEGLKSANHKNKYAWICESRFIGSAKDVRSSLIKNKNLILDKYQFLFTCDRELCSLDSRIKWCYAGSNLPWCYAREYRSYVPNKTKLVSMICSPKEYSDGHRFRLNIANRLHPSLDLFGGAFGSIRPGEGTGAHRDKSQAMDPYMFSVVIENDSYSDYFTEKITDCFARGVVPIYYGTPNISQHFNSKGIIPFTENFSVKDLSVDLYKSLEPYIQDNMQRVESLKMAEDYFVEEYIIK